MGDGRLSRSRRDLSSARAVVLVTLRSSLVGRGVAHVGTCARSVLSIRVVRSHS